MLGDLDRAVLGHGHQVGEGSPRVDPDDVSHVSTVLQGADCERAYRRAPRVIPRTMWRCSRKTARKRGTSVTTEPAASSPHRVAWGRTMLARARGTVWAARWVSIRAKRNSFHEKTNTKIAVTARPDRM